MDSCNSKCEEYRALLKDVLEWFERDDVQACFQLAYAHDIGLVTKEECQSIQDMWWRVSEAVEKKEKTCQNNTTSEKS